ncbi:MAG: CorA family divalent cation transporter [Streptosporangiaceae bacterium]
MRRAGSVHQLPHSDPVRTLHPIISSLYTQFAALYLRLDQRLDELDQQVLREADDEELAEITAIRHRAGMSRRMLIPGRNLAARMPLIRSLPGATSESRPYAEDIYDELQSRRCAWLCGAYPVRKGSFSGSGAPGAATRPACPARPVC